MPNAHDPYTIPVYRLQLVQDGQCDGTRISGPEAVAKSLESIAMSDREQVICIHLDTKHRAIARQTVSVGTLNECFVHPREVFKAALVSNAHAIVLAHNHPSGDVTPSSEDDEITTRIIDAGNLVGVALLDHVILSPNSGCYSYRESQPHLFGTVGYRSVRKCADM